MLVYSTKLLIIHIHQCKHKHLLEELFNAILLKEDSISVIAFLTEVEVTWGATIATVCFRSTFHALQ
jgi:hypothetical protein